MDAITIQMSNIFGDTIPGYGDRVDVLSYSHGVAKPANDPRSPDRTGNVPLHQDFVITKLLDAASPLLNQACSEGRLFGEITIWVSLYNSGNVQPMITYTLRDVMITAVTVSAGGDKPLETLALNYTRIRWEFAGKNGAVTGSWDLQKNASS